MDLEKEKWALLGRLESQLGSAATNEEMKVELERLEIIEKIEAQRRRQSRTRLFATLGAATLALIVATYLWTSTISNNPFEIDAGLRALSFTTADEVAFLDGLDAGQVRLSGFAGLRIPGLRQDITLEDPGTPVILSHGADGAGPTITSLTIPAGTPVDIAPSGTGFLFRATAVSGPIQIIIDLPAGIRIQRRGAAPLVISDESPVPETLYGRTLEGDGEVLLVVRSEIGAMIAESASVFDLRFLEETDTFGVFASSIARGKLTLPLRPGSDGVPLSAQTDLTIDGTAILSATSLGNGLIRVAGSGYANQIKTTVSNIETDHGMSRLEAIAVNHKAKTFWAAIVFVWTLTYGAYLALLRGGHPHA